MKGSQILRELKERDIGDKRFIKWWRRENDFVDYELIEHFTRDVSEDQDFAGYELLDTEQMWQALQGQAGERVRREKRTQGEFLLWEKEEGEVQECPFTPKNVIAVFDAETRGNVID